MGWYPFAILLSQIEAVGLLENAKKKNGAELGVGYSKYSFFLKMRIRLGTGFKRTLLIYVIKKVFIIDLS